MPGMLLPILQLSLLLAAAHAQNSTGIQPFTNAATAILADGRLYIFGGTIKFAEPLNLGTRQFLSLDLTQSFSTLNPPWAELEGYLTYSAITGVPSRTGKQFIIAGNRNNDGALSYIYDTTTAKWVTTQTLPGLSSMVGYKRYNPGMALDKDRGLVYIYGGLQQASFSSELSVLDSTKPTPEAMSWTVAKNNTGIPALYEPIVVYLPTIKSVFVVGGCHLFDTASGRVKGCAAPNVGYLVSNGISSEAVQVRSQVLSNGPVPRYLACRIILGNGNLFIQGGRDLTAFFDDAWVLDVKTWKWEQVTITGAGAALKRAGHSCQMGPNGQIIVAGGYVDAGIFVAPSIGIINSKNWTWTTNYRGATLDRIWSEKPIVIPDPPPRDPEDPDTPTDPNTPKDPKTSEGLSAGAKGGIGAVVAIGVIAVGVGFFFWRKKKANRSWTDKPRAAEAGGYRHDHEKSATTTTLDRDYDAAVGPSAPANPRELTTLATGSAVTVDSGAGTGQGRGSPVSADPHRTLNGSPVTARATIVLSTPSLVDLHHIRRMAESDPLPLASPTETEPLTSLPSYTGPSGGLSSPTTGKGARLGRFTRTAKTEKSSDEDALAAALLRAEDQVSSHPAGRNQSSPASLPMTSPSQYSLYDPQVPMMPPRPPKQTSLPTAPASTMSELISASTALTTDSVPTTSSFSPRSPAAIPAHFELVPVNSSSVYSTSTNSSAPSRTPTIHTSVHSEPLERSRARGTNGPQSIPEYEAYIERASPGVKTHIQRVRDVDDAGFYPPLTPVRPYAASSIIVGDPVPHPLTTTSFPTSFSQMMAAKPDAGSNVHTGPPRGQGQYAPGPSTHYGAPQSPPYRDPRVAKDLENISKMIESQMQMEAKGPQALVSSEKVIPALPKLTEDDEWSQSRSSSNK